MAGVRCSVKQRENVTLACDAVEFGLPCQAQALFSKLRVCSEHHILAAILNETRPSRHRITHNAPAAPTLTCICRMPSSSNLRR